MADLVVIVPSRGRPHAARELAAAFADTSTAGSLLVFVVDEDDPTLPGYEGIGDGYRIGVVFTPTRTMVQALNLAAVSYANTALGLDVCARPFAVGFMGDDHRPRTAGWDQAYLEALRGLGTGIVYGDDLLQGQRMPTQCAMSADIVRALGYMAPPDLTHLYVDNVWLALGEAAGCIRYLPEVVVEHLHPAAGKAAMDAGYARVNALYDVDGQVFAGYRGGQLASDVAKVRALRGAQVPS